METTETVRYYIGEALFCEVPLGSLFDLAIQDMIREQRKAESKLILDMLSNSPNVKYTKPSKDILKALKV